MHHLTNSSRSKICRMHASTGYSLGKFKQLYPQQQSHIVHSKKQVQCKVQLPL